MGNFNKTSFNFQISDQDFSFLGLLPAPRIVPERNRWISLEIRRENGELGEKFKQNSIQFYNFPIQFSFSGLLPDRRKLLKGISN